MLSEPKTTPSRSEVPTVEIPIYITKSNFFRVVHVDGVYGGGTPTPGNIMMTLFSHRVPFPEIVVNDASGSEVLHKRKVKHGIEQEYEVSLVMNIDTARSIHAWLAKSIKNIEDALRLTELKKLK